MPHPYHTFSIERIYSGFRLKICWYKGYWCYHLMGVGSFYKRGRKLFSRDYVEQIINRMIPWVS
jgi:hypothetical protein